MMLSRCEEFHFTQKPFHQIREAVGGLPFGVVAAVVDDLQAAARDLTLSSIGKKPGQRPGYVGHWLQRITRPFASRYNPLGAQFCQPFLQTAEFVGVRRGPVFLVVKLLSDGRILIAHSSYSPYGMKKPNSRAAVSCCSSSVMKAKPVRLLVRDSRLAKCIALARCHKRTGDKLTIACILAISEPRLPLG